MSQTNEVIIGVDVAKDKLDIYVHPVANHFVISNDEKAIKTFFSKLNQEYKIKMVVLESTGGYEKRCVKVVSNMNVAIHIAHPNQVYHFAKSHKLFAKTDKIDAKTLALFGEEDHVLPSTVKSISEQENQELMRRKHQLTDSLTVEKVRLAHDLSKSVKDSIKRFIKQIEREIELINTKIQEKVVQNEELVEKIKLLESFKGVGNATATMLTLCLPELGELNRAEIARLLGVAPINHDSGNKKGYRAIQGGRFHVRKMLYMVVLSALKYNHMIKPFYDRLIASGKKSKVAIVACMRKIIIILNAMLRDKKEFSILS